jgi:protein-L-isoaspartate(D-aspartate) O-methyltransferase
MYKDIDYMIAGIENEVEFTRSMIGKNQLDARVMDAMRRVPRDRFVPLDMKDHAFNNGPLPIGHGQTISQPYIVALMTDMLELEPDHVVLEIGTGCGYQAAVLAELARQVYSVEFVQPLADEASRRLTDLNYTNVSIHVGNGYDGWPDHAPYDAVIVTAAATHIPKALVDQLKPGGRMAIPVGLPWSHQELMLLTRDEQGEIHSKDVLGVAFVPLVESPAAMHGESVDNS